MIGLDSNVLVRYLAQDDEDQAARATAVIEGLQEDDPGFVSLVALVETYWVLRRAYRVGVEEAAAVVRRLLESRELVLHHPEAIHRALRRVTGQHEFTDALISELGREAGCDHTVTFDHRAALIDGMALVPPADPPPSG